MNILLIDDDKLTLKAMKKLISGLGYRVVLASNKLNALKRLREEPIDCVISDVHMPDTSIAELFEAIRSEHPQLPIIFISTEASNPDIDKTLLRGADAFIPKPVQPLLLDRVIRRLTARRVPV